MNTLITMTLDEVKKNPLTEEEKNVIRRAAAQVRAGTAEDDPDCPKQTKEELAKFRPWYEVHPEWCEAKKNGNSFADRYRCSRMIQIAGQGIPSKDE